MKYLTILGLFVFLACAGTAQAAHNDHTTYGHMGSMSEMNQEYMRAMNDMHTPMMRGVMDSDPDAAFVRGMLWHHRGAVDMAKIQLKYGKDPEMRKLAEDIIKAQDSEIRQMENWLKSRNLPE